MHVRRMSMAVVVGAGCLAMAAGSAVAATGPLQLDLISQRTAVVWDPSDGRCYSSPYEGGRVAGAINSTDKKVVFYNSTDCSGSSHATVLPGQDGSARNPDGRPAGSFKVG
ncbi:hypothetical protein A8924_4870 [Saccharopolyspora erythraea NRRL 2338]|uniref:Uncharacterized protein n=2 Tax=Saccharopolyspora erythraea TaxID=1836 RepID=A4FI77_SACEN|nr:hypothetical protein [Saccharopolyspora erythraea]PFG97432.1 hypothetical protein A8924_4870 [Saccharopolyspora erythraea NRRL 2338]QRK87611.1 hypothetical protein JQX30_22825 [Saccharopolyspora erythraea]CAM03752.1 hypothetical protein SACE_4483 [Saccharopolyspora erythraea NRRL 2338]